jgi:hypothetical protein
VRPSIDSAFFLVCYSGESIVHGTRLFAQVRDVAVVLDHVIGSRTRVFWIDLRRHARADMIGIDSIARYDARDTLFIRCDDDDRLIDHLVVSGLKEQRYDVHDKLIRLRVGLALLGKPAHGQLQKDRRSWERPLRGQARRYR